MAKDRAEPDSRPPKDGLSVAVVTVEELYAGAYTFNLPWYQRAYAWTEELARRLLGDIHQAYEDGTRRYFIGHVLLARKAGETSHVLVDGQQRAVTLMILFAILRHKLAGTSLAERIVRLLEAKTGAEDTIYRLMPQPALQAFFLKHVQSPDALSHSTEEFGASEVERNVINNRAALGELLDELSQAGTDLSDLAEFLLTRCLLVLEVVDDERDNEAWEMLQIEENTGLPFHDAARTKITLIEAMPPEQREDAGRLWENCQAQLGDDGMQQLVEHVRDLSVRRRSSQPVEKDIVTRYELDKVGLEFMERSLVPSAQRLAALRDHQVGTEDQRTEISLYLRHLECTGLPYWCLAGIRWLEKNGDGHADTASFFRLLARKTWLLRISGADKVEHQRRFIALSSQIDDGFTLAAMSELNVAEKTSTKVRENLLSRTFYVKGYSRSVLRYLSDLMGDKADAPESTNVTIEHVLPKSPRPGSDWARNFENSKEFAHRIGNMALLSFQENQQVGNKEYGDKRRILANSRFAISRDAAQSESWSPEHVIERSETLVDVLFDHWRLKM